MLREELEEEEFQEADILWPDVAQDLELPQMYYSHDDGDDNGDDYGDDEYSDDHRPTKPHNRQKASSPIDIPTKTGAAADAKGTKAVAGCRIGDSRAGAGGSGLRIGSHALVPPHVIVDRKVKRDTAMLMLVDVPKGRLRAMVMLE